MMMVHSATAHWLKPGDHVLDVGVGSIETDGPFQKSYNLVIANIVSRVLVELAPALARAVAPGGTLILGGILDDKEESAHEAFAAAPLSLVRRVESEDWVALVMRKPE